MKIPHPRPYPVVKNLPQVDPDKPIQALTKLARDYDGIYQIFFPNATLTVVTSQELVNELCNEKRFQKKLSRPLLNLRPLAKDGLFTAHNHEPNWALAHQVLTPAFGPRSLKNLYPLMLDIAEQMFLKWERFGDETIIDVSDNMTRLTLDTIALASFDYRFNSFYEREMHPFVGAMVRSLDESSRRMRRPELLTKAVFEKTFTADNKYMHELARKLIEERRTKASDKQDLLHYMLESGLSDENIIYQLVTFLIAGHETTSGMLSFTIYEILKNPEVLKKLQKEVDDVLGSKIPTSEDLLRLTYLDQVFKESLRLWPTAPAWAVESLEEKTTLGKYDVTREDTIMVVLPALHRDPKVWSDPEKFDPDRMAPDKFRALPPNCWKPFGNGQRACIGRGFAMMEASLVMCMMLQRFDIELADPGYKLEVKETLTLKPHGLNIRARRRKDKIISHPTVIAHRDQAPVVKLPDGGGQRLQILFGSNTGTSEGFAKRIAKDAEEQHFEVELAPLDSAIGKLTPEAVLLIVVSSYEGQPPRNARKFIQWLDTLKAQELQGVRFMIFGCGNRDWKDTYQAVPRKIHEKLLHHGARQLGTLGEADAAGDFAAHFEDWYKGLFPCLATGQLS